MQSSFKFIFILCLSLSIPPIVAKPLGHVVLKIATYPDKTDPNYQFDKIGRDILAEVSRRWHGSLEFQAVPWPRATHLFDVGRVDGIAWLSIEDPKKYKTAITDFNQLLNVSVYVKKGDLNKISNKESLKSKKLAMLRGSNIEFLRLNADSINAYEVEYSHQLISMLLENRFDAVIDMEHSMQFLIEKYQLTEQIIKAFDVETWPMVIGLSEITLGDRANIYTSEFDLILREMKLDGTLDRIYNLSDSPLKYQFKPQHKVIYPLKEK